MKFLFRGLEFTVWPTVYEPAEDSVMMAENLRLDPGERVLDLGTGCGILAILAALMGGEVVATDVNPDAISCAGENARRHGVANRIDLRLGSLFDPVRGEKFDLILFNPPYLPTAPDERDGSPLELAWDGGDEGRSVIDRFLEGLPDHMSSRGRAMFLHSSLSGERRTVEAMEKAGLRWRVLCRRKLFFEELILFECRGQPPNAL
jgi:release factor glutamine methyltransferase